MLRLCRRSCFLHNPPILLNFDSPRLHFVNELLEVGGLMTLLEVITLKQANEEHKQRALKVFFAGHSSAFRCDP